MNRKESDDDGEREGTEESENAKWNEDDELVGNENESCGVRQRVGGHGCEVEGCGTWYENETDHGEAAEVGVHGGQVGFGSGKIDHLMGYGCGNDGEVGYVTECASESGNDAKRNIIRTIDDTRRAGGRGLPHHRL